MEKPAFNRTIRQHWPPQALPGDATSDRAIAERIKELLPRKNAVILAHYYTDPQVQMLAEETGGFIGDSLEMARFGAEHPATTLLIAGVRFMGESAKILSPEKRVLMPDLAAECSLDLGCDPGEFKEFCAANPDRVVVVYANTSAAVKAIADWTVTSSIAIDVVRYLASCGQKIIWAPDRYLGSYIQRLTGADMLLWDACCIVHAEFDANAIKRMKADNPGAMLLVHPESRHEIVEIADVVGSTSQLLQASRKSDARQFVVATESGILYKMQQASPGKEFIMAPTMAQSSDYQCNGSCPWMKMNSLQKIYDSLANGSGEISLTQEIISRAKRPLARMLDFKNRTVENQR